MMNHCPICNSEMEYIFTTKDYLVSGEAFDIIECDSCLLRITNPFPNKHNIGRYYSSDDYISHNENASGIFNYI